MKKSFLKENFFWYSFLLFFIYASFLIYSQEIDSETIIGGEDVDRIETRKIKVTGRTGIWSYEFDIDDIKVGSTISPSLVMHRERVILPRETLPIPITGEKKVFVIGDELNDLFLFHNKLNNHNLHFSAYHEEIELDNLNIHKSDSMFFSAILFNEIDLESKENIGHNGRMLHRVNLTNRKWVRLFNNMKLIYGTIKVHELKGFDLRDFKIFLFGSITGIFNSVITNEGVSIASIVNTNISGNTPMFYTNTFKYNNDDYELTLIITLRPNIDFAKNSYLINVQPTFYNLLVFPSVARHRIHRLKMDTSIKIEAWRIIPVWLWGKKEQKLPTIKADLIDKEFDSVTQNLLE